MTYRLSLLTICFFAAFNGNAQEVFKTYYPNGHVKAVTHQGIFQGCGVPVDTDSLFYPNGQVQKTIRYRHSLNSGNDCHAIITREAIVLYYPNGRRRSLQFLEYCYECEPTPVGEWVWYDKSGNVLRRDKKN
jgi:antitoxin component YwqK of YwqJK toxin-antitoxin module